MSVAPMAGGAAYLFSIGLIDPLDRAATAAQAFAVLVAVVSLRAASSADIDLVAVVAVGVVANAGKSADRTRLFPVARRQGEKQYAQSKVNNKSFHISISFYMFQFAFKHVIKVSCPSIN